MGFVLFFLFGLVVGSFLNVLIYRLPLELSVVKGYSMCPACEHRLFPRDLVPLFSWLLLRRRCRYCSAPVSWRYPAVELLNALLWLAISLRYGIGIASAAYCMVASCLLVVLFVDWEHQIIPDSMHVGIFIAGLLLAFWGAPALGWPNRIIGLFSVSVLFLLIVLISGGRAMGGGDVKLMAALGFCLGWKQALLITMLGSVVGSIIALAQRCAATKRVPFGSFLAAAGILSLFFGDTLIAWYTALCGF